MSEENDKSILVVDDEEPILQAISYSLRKEGYRVHLAANAEACMHQFREHRPNLIILDVMLPSASGFQVCKKIRASSDVPIILLTARVEEADKVFGLELGADDYVTKPFSMKELMARVKANLRRQPEGESGSAPIIAGNLTIDEARHEVTLSGRKVDLAPKEFALLTFLVKHPDLVFSREALIDRVWGPDAFVDERTIDVHMRWLRSKIEVDPASPTRLMTVRGLGYKFNSESS